MAGATMHHWLHGWGNHAVWPGTGGVRVTGVRCQKAASAEQPGEWKGWYLGRNGGSSIEGVWVEPGDVAPPAGELLSDTASTRRDRGAEVSSGFVDVKKVLIQTGSSENTIVRRTRWRYDSSDTNQRRIVFSGVEVLRQWEPQGVEVC